LHTVITYTLGQYPERNMAKTSDDGRTVLGDPRLDRVATAILAALQASAGGLTRTQIRRAVIHGHETGEVTAAKLESLHRYGLATAVTVATGGRPAERWFAVAESPNPDGSAEASPPVIAVDLPTAAPATPSDPTPGVVDHRPGTRAKLRVALRALAAEFRAERIDREERAAKAELDRGLTREAAERPAGEFATRLDRDAEMILGALRSARNGLTRFNLRVGYCHFRPATFIQSKLDLLRDLGLVVVPRPMGDPDNQLWFAIERLGK
jgi:hypothetical protein